MAITLKRQLNDDEKRQILEQHGKVCFATGHTIPEGESVHFDHIRAFASGGISSPENIAPMCEKHNKQKGRLPLDDFRVKLKIEKFFDKGDKLTLRDLLEHLKDTKQIDIFAEPLSIINKGECVSIESSERNIEIPVYKCPTTNSTYFYASLPAEWIDSDDDEDEKVIGLQPRYLIYDKVFQLYRHFQQHTVLQPSVGRIVNNKHIRLFDGQHKIASLLWLGRKRFDCKIFLDHDVRLLNQTNIAAHDKFAQTRFYSSVMVLKLGNQFGNDFERYKNQEDENTKSEAGFMSYLEREKDSSLTKADLNKRFRSYLFNSILEDKNNKLNNLVSPSNRSTSDKPLTIDMLNKSIFACFLYRKPTEDDMATSSYMREHEINNIIRLMNILYDKALCDWDSKIGYDDMSQIKLNRLFRSKSIMAWCEILRDAIAAGIELFDAEEKERPFYREMSELQNKKIDSIIGRLIDWKIWASPKNSEIDNILTHNKSEVKKWFKSHNLTTGYLMGAPE